ncbi:MAG: sugar kinase [Bacteroidetes bacterium]|nr:sugar kinase [Bacteroidota bacterium]
MENHKFQLAAFGEFLLRLHCSDNKRFLQSPDYIPYYGGAEANVCVLLSRLGVKTNYISCVPQNDMVKAGIDQLKSHGVGTENMLYEGDKLGLYFTEQGNSIRHTKVIYDRLTSSYSFLQKGKIDWKKALDGSTYFHWSGIGAAVSQSAADVCEEAIIAAKESGMVISSDFNYRSTLWKYGKAPAEIMPALLQHSEVAVADLDSAHVYFGIETDKNASFEERFKQCSEMLLEKMPQLKSLAMSFRKVNGMQHIYSGALMHNREYYFSPAYELSFITDQIGSGDSFTAGFLFGLMNNFQPKKIIEFATACGAVKQSIAGDWAIVNKQDIDQFIQSGATGRIIR